jgi:RNA polymerase sigma-70 factor (ECF subfamily)
MTTNSFYHQNGGFLQEELLIIEKAKINPTFFAPLYNKYYKAIFSYINNRVDEKESAYDITSCVFTKALTALHKYEFRGIPFSSWLFRIAKSELYQSFRDKKASKTVNIKSVFFTPAIDEFNEDDFEDKLQILLKSLSVLKPQELELIEKRFYEKRSFSEIGEELGITENNAKVKTFRALLKLKKQYNRSV